MITIDKNKGKYIKNPIQINIHLDRPGEKVALFLSSTNIPIIWQLTKTGGSSVSTVVIAGNVNQTLGKGFNSQTVYDLSNRTIKHRTLTFNSCDQFSSKFELAFHQSVKLAGMSPNSLHIVCNPTNHPQITIDQINNDEELSRLSVLKSKYKPETLDPLVPASGVLIKTKSNEYNLLLLEEQKFQKNANSLPFEDLVKGLKSPSPRVRSIAERTLASHDSHADKAIPFLITALTNSDPQPDRNTCFKLLREIGQPSVAPLIKLYKQSDSRTKSSIENIFQSLGPKASAATPILINRLENDINNKEPLSWRAIEALGEIGPPAQQAIPLLRELEKSESNRTISEALKKIGPTSSYDFKYYAYYYLIYGLAGLLTIVFTCIHFHKPRNTMGASRIISFGFTLLMLPITLANPFCIFIGYGIAGSLNFSSKISTNIYQVEFLPYITILYILVFVRFILFVLMSRPALKLHLHSDLLLYFSRNNIIQLPWIIILYLFTLPIEGNIMGFFLVPLIIFSTAINTSIITMLNLRSIKKIKTCVKSTQG